MAEQGRSKDRSRATTKLHPGPNQAKPRHQRRQKPRLRAYFSI